MARGAIRAGGVGSMIIMPEFAALTALADDTCAVADDTCTAARNEALMGAPLLDLAWAVPRVRFRWVTGGCS